MKRSKWKGPFIKPANLKKISEGKSKTNGRTVKRVSEIMPNHIGLSLLVHNGKDSNEVKVTEEMLGHKFGEFVFTRSKFSFKKKKSQK